MTRARILADYVSSGDELALKAPIAGPTFTGTVAIPNVANLETAVVANTAKVTNYNQTLADINALDVTELGTVTSANLANTAIVYPAGHVLRTFYVESDAVTHSLSVAGSALYWPELELVIPASATADLMIITVCINGILTEDAGSFLQIGFGYSDDNWSTITQLGTVAVYDRPQYSSTADTTVGSASVTIRVNHPTTNAYKIRPKLSAVTNTIDMNQSSTRSTLLAMEVKG